MTFVAHHSAMPQVLSLHLYPVKSCAGMAVDALPLDDRGPIGDRRWMVLDETQTFQTQRERPRLALVRVRLTDDGIVIGGPGMPELAVPRPEPVGSDFVTRVWGDDAPVRPASAQAADWFSTYLGAPMQLVFLPDEGVRVMRAEYAGTITEPRRVSLTDGAPLLLATESSLCSLNQRLPSPVPMNRFRPNVVVRGSEPFAEDCWRRITIGEVVFEVAKPCARCATTTVDQATGDRGVEPLRTLSSFRRQGAGVMFGQNIAHHRPGTLRLGDVVTIVQ